MKTILPKRSLEIKARLDRIIQQILDISKNKVAMIILFGSYARGNWIKDSYVEGHITYSYQSNLDIMIVTKNSRYGGYQGNSLKKKIKDSLEKAGLGWRPFLTPPVTIILETIQHVNEELEKSRYFFSDIKKEDILLYDTGKFTLAEPKDLNQKERKKIAKDDYEEWFPQGSSFLRYARDATQNGDLKLAVFLLHQATENFYSAILLVFTGYKNKIHNIEILGSLAGNYSDELLKIFPCDTKERNDCFVLLQEAYVKARYDKKYKITEEQLLYLINRVKKLKTVTEELCQARIKNCNL